MDSSVSTLSCQTDQRRHAVRRTEGANGLDYVEVADDERTLSVYFLGRLPPELLEGEAGIIDHVLIEGGDRITDLRIVDARTSVSADPERDDVLVLTLDRTGDFSPYLVRLTGVANVDSRYATASFQFHLDCASDLDCTPACSCPPAVLDEPELNYLGKDYASFRQLILDRMSLLVPEWTERHVPDLGVTLVELLAYTGDYLSYYQDAVATEAYLDTARQRISVRRHLRLIDYRLHEGCNARAWVHVAVTQNVTLPSAQVAFITGRNAAIGPQPSIIAAEALATIPTGAYEYFEPMTAVPDGNIQLRAAHNEIHFYTWGDRECCLPEGATHATLVDGWTSVDDVDEGGRPPRALEIAPGDVLILEEVRGPRTGSPADAAPMRRHAVRVTAVRPSEDPLYPVGVGENEGEDKDPTTLPTPLLEVEWASEDALPFPLCLSAIGAPPACAAITDISVARGNVVLVDHGRTVDPEPLPPVPGDVVSDCCDCEGHPADPVVRIGRYRPTLGRPSLTFREATPDPGLPAAVALVQDPHAALPEAHLSDGQTSWIPRHDLLSSGPQDAHFVVEADNDGIAHLRFGDGRLGREPALDRTLNAAYRVGGGRAGNVGADSISHLVLSDLTIDGLSVGVRNPMPARGGLDPEPIAEAKLVAPGAVRATLERAIIADDYARLAERDRKTTLQRASAQLAWTGSWYEAEVAIDPWDKKAAAAELVESIDGALYRYRRIGHDLRVLPAASVPIALRLAVCALSGYEPGHVRAALLARFSNRRNPDGTRGFFHPDVLSFGEPIELSGIVAAARSVGGVGDVTVIELHRSLEPPRHEIANGVLPLAANEIARLDNDPDHPERGWLQIDVEGGQ